MNWLFTLGVPGPLVPTVIGNYPVTISYLSSNTFGIVAGFPDLAEGDSILVTGGTIAGTYTVGGGVTLSVIPVTPSIPFFSGTENVYIEVTRPASDTVETVIEEPIGLDNLVFNIMRDDKWHGIFFEASTTQLGFYGDAYNTIKAEKEAHGVDAIVIFTASVMCDGESEYTDVISGKLSFPSYQETCGRECIIRMSVERGNCAMTFKNRFDQKVDVEVPKAFDKVTNLVQYTGLDFTLSLATQEIPISADADVSLDGDGTSLGPATFEVGDTFLIRPSYERVTDNSILTGQLNDAINLFEDVDKTFMLTPQVLMEENQLCINEEFEYDVRMKGSITVTYGFQSGDPDLQITLILDTWDGTGTHVANRTVLDSTLVNADAQDGVTYNFDTTWTGSAAIAEGLGVYAYIEISLQDGIINTFDFTYEFDPETYFVLSNTKACLPTDAEVNLIHELLARLTESITDRCLTIKSEYYGRTDSQPYSYDTDGCGSLRVLTPGLKIRQATDKKFFASMKEVMEGLRAIDNIGMGPEGDLIIRIEPAEYFYQDVKIMDIDLVPTSRDDIEESLIYSNLKTGYSKWEVKSIKGIDEFNSAKEHRTSIKAINNPLDIRSDLIASGYIIENLRTSTLVNTGNTDSTYDNDIFIICVKRDMALTGYEVEQGIVQNAANFFSPTTAYNWRIRPIYNLMRWFKSISQSYVNLANTASKLFFASGTGNYLAEGQIDPTALCTLENKVLAENDDIAFEDFINTSDATPIYKPEIISFEYPLSIKDYKLIQATPYGYLNVQCGTGGYTKAFIKNIEYKPAEGTASFTLIKKWQ